MFSNRDRYNQKIEAGDYFEAARLAIGFSAGCASRNNAWNWAEEAVKAAAMAGITIDPGRGGWPNLERMEAQIKEETCRE